MSRFRLRSTDIPVRARTLPALPHRQPVLPKSLEDSWFHKVLVWLELAESWPAPVAIGLTLVLDAATAWVAGTTLATLVLTCQLADAFILGRLGRKGISFGPLKIQWLMLAGARVLAACTVSQLLRFIDNMPSGALPLPLLMGAALQAMGIFLVLRGFCVEPGGLTQDTLDLDVRGLLPHAELRLLHVADVHTERCGKREQLLIDRARQARPDVILFTGDFLNLSYVHDARAQQDARSLWAVLGEIAPVFAVSGSPPVDAPAVVAQILQGLPVRWLRDEIDELKTGCGTVRVVGVSCTHNAEVDGVTLRRLLAQQPCTDEGTPALTILLHHSPDLAPQAAELGVIDLHLAGHTHGGQIRLPGFGALVTSSLYFKALEMGLYRLRDMLLFVSRGVGLEGKGAPRVRLLCRPQLALFVLHGPAEVIA